MGRIGPTPGFEGGGLDREVLGQKNFAGVTRIVLGDRTPDGKGVQVRAGEVHGLTKGPSFGCSRQIHPTIDPLDTSS